MILRRLQHFLNPFDRRYEDLSRGSLGLNLFRDLTAGLVVAMIAIPLAMGFAMASGLRPEQGIVGGAIAGLVGALFGGSKYQVYGPTAAFIPIIGAIMSGHDHAFLVLCSMLAAVILAAMSLAGLGRVVKRVPHSIVVGFTIGIAVTIASSQASEVLGLQVKAGYGALDKLRAVAAHWGDLQLWAVILGVGTLVVTKLVLRISVFLPAPLVALAIGVLLTGTVLDGEGLVLVRDKFGAIPAQGVRLTLPAALDPSTLGELAYYALAIVFVAAIESLLCSRMADRLAGNTRTPYDPDKELWGQANVMAWVPLLNGFPHTGALARTATNIKLGAISPLAGILKCVLKLGLAFYLARWLELVPMACIGGILLYVAMNMVKRSEIDEVFAMGRGHVWLMLYTAATVIALDFLRGVLSALAIYVVWQLVRSKQPAAGARARPLGRVVVAGGEATAGAPAAPSPVRAVVDRAGGRRRADAVLPERRVWLQNLRRPASIARSAFVHGKANVVGRVVLGDHVYIAPGASVRADEGAPFYIGASSNIQDGVVIHALKDRHVLVDGERWAVFVGEHVSIAHDALVHGPCHVGDHTFIGFKAVVHDAVVGARCFIGIGAVVVGVEVPEGRFVPHGSIVDTPEKAQALPPASSAHHHFNDDVVEVNRGLAAAYREHAARGPAPAAPARFEDTWAPPLAASDRF